MIAHLTGTVTAVGATSAVLDIGGFGTLVHCSPQTVSGLRLGQRSTLQTSLVVREDSLTLYGFADTDERDCFELLLTASGVGPRIAQAACAVLSPAELRQAISTDDVVTLTRVPGVGKKGAERICVELRDKIGALSLTSAAGLPATTSTRESWREQVATGLQGLGWSARDAEAACDRVGELAGTEPQPPVAELMRAALRSLART
ncbi:Holliday junction branch migration protein RuvA [Auraticoccus monumenti]|uniref:Holliday junction branch migration complex subunit RuvA n=1 Tax=Auraticoccus monumenti TaxID=675864 RepID=A0A1G7B7Q3_9ACTN|nr:Holliday junction branch migration protein RuvA [Auraticoccus monumenti]SDE23071.1 Holliday junction DNA helicase subunit RuvA [Auraticoccus monumenti]